MMPSPLFSLSRHLGMRALLLLPLVPQTGDFLPPTKDIRSFVGYGTNETSSQDTAPRERETVAERAHILVCDASCCNKQEEKQETAQISWTLRADIGRNNGRKSCSGYRFDVCFSSAVKFLRCKSCSIATSATACDAHAIACWWWRRWARRSGTRAHTRSHVFMCATYQRGRPSRKKLPGFCVVFKSGYYSRSFINIFKWFDTKAKASRKFIGLLRQKIKIFKAHQLLAKERKKEQAAAGEKKKKNFFCIILLTF